MPASQFQRHEPHLSASCDYPTVDQLQRLLDPPSLGPLTLAQKTALVLLLLLLLLLARAGFSPALLAPARAGKFPAPCRLL